MILRRTTLLLSLLLHLIIIYWIIRVEVPILIYPEKEKVIAVVPVSFPPLPEISFLPGKKKTREKISGKVTGLIPGSRSGSDSIPTTFAENTSKGISSDFQVEESKLTTPPPEVKEIPNLSIYSENIRDIIRNVNWSRIGTGSKEKLSGVGEGAANPDGGSQVYFNLENYDLSPWAKRVLLRIHKNWMIPMATKIRVKQPVEVAIIIEKNGNISSIKIKQSSNSDTFDQAAVNSIRLSSPLPVLPRDFPGVNLEVRFLFASSELAADTLNRGKGSSTKGWLGTGE
jgi:TonB family protein